MIYIRIYQLKLNIKPNQLFCLAKHGTSKVCCTALAENRWQVHHLQQRMHRYVDQCLPSCGGERSCVSAMPKPLTDEQIAALLAVPYDSELLCSPHLSSDFDFLSILSYFDPPRHGAKATRY